MLRKLKSKNKVYSFGEHLRSLREKEMLSLKQVSIAIGIDISLIGKIERNERNATKEQIKSIAKFYNYDEKLLIQENLSDQLAYKILEADVDNSIFKIAEQKVRYFKKNKIK